MKNGAWQEYLKLVRETRLFIESQLPAHTFVEKEEAPFIVNRRKPAEKAHKEATPQSPPAPEAKKEILSQVTAKGGQANPTIMPKNTEWELHPMGHVEERPSLRQKLSSYVPTCEPQIGAFLILPEENPSHRLFLESLSRAITRSFIPASVVVYDPTLFQKAEGKLIVVPLSLLKKKHPHALPHTLIEEGAFKLLAIENLDLYGHDPTCKRALWRAIQSLFRS
jgi:hypothetical protein